MVENSVDPRHLENLQDHKEVRTPLQLSDINLREIYKIVREQIEFLGLQGSLALLDESGKNLVFKVVLNSIIKNNSRKYDQMSEQFSPGYIISVAEVAPFYQAISLGKPIFS